MFSPIAGQNLFTLRLLQIGQVNERSLGRAQLPLRQNSYYAIVPAASSPGSTPRLGAPSVFSEITPVRRTKFHNHTGATRLAPVA
jgi:hypothetical protein